MTDDHRDPPAGAADGLGTGDLPAAGLVTGGPGSSGLGTGDPGIDGLDADRLHADDLLLDVLGRGAAAPADDPLAALLAAWRTDLDEDPSDLDAALVEAFCGAPVPAPRPAAPLTGSPAKPLTGSPPGSVAMPARSGRLGRRLRGSTGSGSTGPGATRSSSTGPDTPRGPVRRVSRIRRILVGVATVVVGAAVLLIGANNAGPTSPLWPVARLVYPQQAAVRAVEHEIDLAGQALADRRYDPARAHLDRADEYAAEVDDPTEAGRLRAEIARLRASLLVADRDESATPQESRPGPGGSGEPGGPGASATPVPSATPGPEATPTPGDGTSVAPSSQPTRPGLLPLLPTPLLPNLPLLPDLPLLPSLLPSGLPLL